jgi:hypothetical protein
MIYTFYTNEGLLPLELKNNEDAIAYAKKNTNIFKVECGASVIWKNIHWFLKSEFDLTISELLELFKEKENDISDQDIIDRALLLFPHHSGDNSSLTYDRYLRFIEGAKWHKSHK